MPPRLAREAVTAAALRGDTAALLSASAYLPAREAFRYDRRRAAAFASALAGDRELALAELGLGGGVRSLRLELDTAVVELLTRGASPAVSAVGLALKDGVHSEPDVPLLLAECVRRDPETTRAALAVAIGGGTPFERTRAAAAVFGATRFGRVETAVPALAAVSLALAVVAFLRLPGLITDEEAAAPRPREPHPTIVVARPPARPTPAPPRATPPRPETDVIQIAVRPRSTSPGFGAPDSAGAALPTHARTAPRPRPAAPAPGAPATPAAPAAPSSPPATAAAAIAPAAAPPPPRESTRELTAKSRPSKAERKAAKAEQKAASAERKAERKAAKNAAVVAAAAPRPATVAPPPVEAARADAATPNDEGESERPDQHERDEKREKPEKSDKEK